MDLGGVRRKIAHKNCDRINAVKTVNSYVFLNIGMLYDNGFFSMVQKFILTPTVLYNW